MNISKMLWVVSLLLSVLNCNNGSSAVQNDPEKLVNKFFSAWDNKNKDAMERIVTKINIGTLWQFESQKSVKLKTISDCTDSKNRDAYMKYGRGKITKPVDLRIYCLEFDYQYKEGQGGAMNPGISQWQFIVIKETEKSPWLIDCWGY